MMMLALMEQLRMMVTMLMMRDDAGAYDDYYDGADYGDAVDADVDY